MAEANGNINTRSRTQRKVRFTQDGLKNYDNRPVQGRVSLDGDLCNLDDETTHVVSDQVDHGSQLIVLEREE